MALTQAQLDALAEKTSEGKLAVKIDATTPLLYCSGTDPVQVAAEWYYPRNISGSFFMLSDPAAAKTSVKIDNRDGAVETAWYTDRFSGYDVEVHILLRTPPSKEWVLASSVTWVEEKTTTRGGDLTVRLHGASGHRQRFGLTVGNTSLFPRAPKVGEIFVFSGVSAIATPPLGQYDPYPGIPSAYWSLMPPPEADEPPPDDTGTPDIPPPRHGGRH